jgi:predicted small lipoprotein YifL
MDAVGGLHGDRRGVRHFLLLALLLASIAACGPIGAYTPPPPPSAEAATAYLNHLVTLVAESGAGAACSVGASTCPKSLRESDPATVPSAPPRVIGTAVIEPTRRSDGNWDTGGRILKLCGIDGLGRPYYSELLVFQDGNRLIATNPLYWTGTLVASNPVSSETPDLPCS